LIRWLLVASIVAVVGCEPAPTTSDPGHARARPESSDRRSEVNEEVRELVFAVERFVKLQENFATFQMVDEGEKLAREWATQQFPDEAVRVSLIGTRTGYAAFAVSRATELRRIPVIVVEDQVLHGQADFFVYLNTIDRSDAAQWATGWLVLWHEWPREPLGHWSRPPRPDPRWVGDRVEFWYRDLNGRERLVRVDPTPGRWVEDVVESDAPTP